jgi:hypothetical protein
VKSALAVQVGRPRRPSRTTPVESLEDRMARGSLHTARCSTDAQGRNEELNSKGSQRGLGISSMSEAETALDSERALSIDTDRSWTRSKRGSSATGSWSSSNKQDSITVGISEDLKGSSATGSWSSSNKQDSITVGVCEDLKGIEYAEKSRFDSFERFDSFQQLVAQPSPQSKTETVSVLCYHQAGAVEPIFSDVDVLNAVLAEERARAELQKARAELRRIARLIGEPRPQLLHYLGLPHASTHSRQSYSDNGSCCAYGPDHGSDSGRGWTSQARPTAEKVLLDHNVPGMPERAAAAATSSGSVGSSSYSQCVQEHTALAVAGSSISAMSREQAAKIWWQKNVEREKFSRAAMLTRAQEGFRGRTSLESQVSP